MTFHVKHKDIAIISLFIALLIALGFIPPLLVGFLPVPIVLQNLGVLLAAALLGPKRGTIVVALFFLLVLVGLPVLSSRSAGIAVFYGPSGGFLWGWLLAPAIYGLGDRLLGTHHGLWQRGILLWLSGAVLVDGLGALWLSIGLHMPLTSALMASLIFIPGDTLKTVLATLVAERVQHALPVHD